jgi:hypothetical protein
VTFTGGQGKSDAPATAQYVGSKVCVSCHEKEASEWQKSQHHTDGEREWAYDRKSSIGQLNTALDEANAKGWTVVDMKNDWKRIFAFEK